MRDFEWRSALGPWRWLILGSVGLSAGSCGGRSDADSLGADDSSLANTGGMNRGGAGGRSREPTIHWDGGAGGEVIGFGGSHNGGYGGSAYAGRAGSGGTGTYRPAPLCDSPVAMGAGWVQCGSGMIHRAALGACASNLPRPRVIEAPEWYTDTAPDGGVNVECRQDGDCTAGAYGHCEPASWEGLPYCEYGCTTNQDCGAGYACLCGPDIGTCVRASCATDSNCQSGYFCASADTCGTMEFGCQTPLDQCHQGSECTYGSCTLNETTGRRSCDEYGCPVPGRPFFIDGEARLACTVERCDWYGGEKLAPLSDMTDESCDQSELRAALSQGWIEQGLMEHASVAAFARFTLQLLALGAPAELVQKSALAMQDEIRHARDCFALARRHLDREVGPGPLPVDHALDHSDLESVVMSTVLEGCIGETVAAIEASEALAHCEDALVRPVLERIAVEEARHAELAWQFVGWALEGGSEGLRARVEATFAGELTRPREPVAALSAVERALSRRGLLPAALRRDLRARVLSEVIAPCARALFASLSRPRPAAGAGPSDVAHHEAPEPRAPRISPAA